MSSASGKPSRPAGRTVFGPEAMNLPNTITVSRLVLAAALFAMIAAADWWLSATALFVVAAATDALDGYLARRYGQVTILGRILDPFVDKIIVGGAYLFLLERNADVDSGVRAWMVIIVIGREMFVSSLRGILEKQGCDFSASFSGKAKMALQCVSVSVCLATMSAGMRTTGWLRLRDGLLWVAVAVTIWSGLIYLMRGARLLASSDPE